MSWAIAFKLDLILLRFVILFCLILYATKSQGEYFSSTDSIQLLADAEKDLIQWYRNFIAAQAEDFAVFRTFIAKVREDHAAALDDPETFLSNPINSFKLIKRAVNDWAYITEYVKNHTRLHALKTNLTLLESEMQLPDNSELRGAAKGLGRIQTMYNLTTKDLSEGVINGVNYGTELAVTDCYEIAANLFEAKEYPLAIEWFELVLKHLEKGENENITESELKMQQKPKEDYAFDQHDDLFSGEDFVYDERHGLFMPVNSYESDQYFEDNVIFQSNLQSNESYKADITKNSDQEENEFVHNESNTNGSTNTKEKVLIDTLEYLALAKYELGQGEEAISYIHRILEINPEHTFKDLELYMAIKEPKHQTPLDSLSNLREEVWYSDYSRLCQGKQLPQKEFHKLICKLDTLNHPLFTLAPLQIEQLHSDPDITVYYGLLSDEQILNILEEADLYMHRSQVGSGPERQVRDVRVSQQAWLPYNSSSLKYISRTVSAISGYDMSNADLMQVANYGIGGQYDPHHDFTGLEKDGKLLGDRLATHLFYISDVEQGGYTVFPALNVYSKPIKGSMVMWHNLHKSVDPDYRTFHAGCPVIVGTKRICNVWVHAGYQEFRRPCDLISDSYKSNYLFI